MIVDKELKEEANNAFDRVEAASELIETGYVPDLPVTEIADVIEMAADVIDTHGLTKNSYTDKSGAYCCLGALGKVVTNDRQFICAQWVIAKHIYKNSINTPPSLGFAFAVITRFNDDLERTQGDVVDMLKTAAKDLRNGT